MISRITNISGGQRNDIQKSQNFFWLFLSFLLLFGSTGLAHPTVYSDYRLEYADGKWILTFRQKTKQLRDALYMVYPELKGQNLNSDRVLTKTADYISESLTIWNESRQIEWVPEALRYDGLRFNGTFYLKGLPESPESITIRSSGFDEHEHSTNLFTLTLGTEGYTYYFDRSRKEVVFSFDTRIYSQSEGKKATTLPVLLSLAGVALVIILIARIRRG